MSHRQGQCRRGGGEGHARHCSTPTCEDREVRCHPRRQACALSGRGFLLPVFWILFFFFKNTFSSCLFSSSVSFGDSAALAAAVLEKISVLFLLNFLFGSNFKFKEHLQEQYKELSYLLNPIHLLLRFWKNSEES